MRKLFFLIIFASSCNDNSDVPADVIKPPQMQKVLWDMIRVDILADEITKRDSSKNLQIEKSVLTEKVFAIHKINKNTFQESMNFYENHPDLLKTILDSLNTNEASRSYIESEKSRHVPKKPHLALPK